MRMVTEWTVGCCCCCCCCCSCSDYYSDCLGLQYLSLSLTEENIVKKNKERKEKGEEADKVDERITSTSTKIGKYRACKQTAFLVILFAATRLRRTKNFSNFRSKLR
jgi:hypothetical protein